MKPSDKIFLWLALGVPMGSLLISSACRPTPELTASETPTLAPAQTQEVDCSAIESLPIDSPEAQQIVDEFIRNYKEELPTEYMGMAILHSVDRLGDWALIQGSVAGKAKDVIVARQTEQGYQITERYIITAPLESFEEPEKFVPQYFMEKLPEAPDELFTCLDQTWLLGQASVEEPQLVRQLAFIGTNDATTGGMTEIHTVQSDGSNLSVLLSQQMLIMGLVFSANGEQIAFWGCPGSLANDCSPDEDLDVWVVNWNGSNLINLTKDSPGSDGHPDWSPDGRRIVFDSDRPGNSQLYLMNSDGTNPSPLTNDTWYNTEPKWSPDGRWIAYHCSQGGETEICVISP